MSAEPDTRTLLGCPEPLARRYDVALLDLDGVVYLGHEAVPGAPAALARAREQGMRLAFVTNNAARPPSAVAQLLRGLDVPADAGDVINSAQAASHYLAERLPAGARVLVIGTVGLDEALRERRLVPVHRADDDPAAVVQGYSPDVDWAQLAEGAVAIGRGLPWVATNLDPTVPSPRGPLPGNGSLVAALRHATGVTPVATGKPEPTMHRESVQRSGAQRPLVVGDRLDTDIEGANTAGCASLLVLTGVTSPALLLAAPPGLRPGYVAADLDGLLRAHPAPEHHEGGMRCNGWVAAADGGGLAVGYDGPPAAAAGGDADDIDALRALCALAWTRHPDDAPSGCTITARDAAAGATLRRLALC